MQKRRNIRLLIILVSLIIVTSATYALINRDQDRIMENADIFSVADVSEIDSVAIFNSRDTTTLHYSYENWVIDNESSADPQKLTVLFAMLNQVRAKRPVAQANQNYIDSLIKVSGKNVQFFEDDVMIKEFAVAGDEASGVSYFRNDKGTFIVNIPGYRSYLASLFLMNSLGWKNKLIFEDVSWNNLEEVEIDYPNDNGFAIQPKENYYVVEDLATDSLKLLDYLDKVSLLMADEYLAQSQVKNSDSLRQTDPLISIALTDIRKRPFRLSVYEVNDNQYFIGLQDSTQWLYINKSKIRPLLRERSYFRK